MAKSREGGPIATWEREVKMIFCDLCLKEIELGNRPTTHFSKEGWTNLMNNFKERTGQSYDRTQMKNKWDYMKMDWKLWKELKRDATGLGWDPIRRTIDASDDWWQEKLKVIPNAKKFRLVGIDPELEEKLDSMFMGVVATGMHSYTPSQVIDEFGIQVDSEHTDKPNYSNDFLNESHQNIDDIAECSNSKPRTSATSNIRKRRKQGGDFLRNQIIELVNVCKQLESARGPSISEHRTSTVAEAIKILEQSEIFDDIPLYLFSLKLLEDATKREIFMSMTATRRAQYVRYCFENKD